jgi:hypothetical protein
MANARSAEMLVNMNTGNTESRMPHLNDYRRWTGRLSSDELAAIRFELNRRIDGGAVHTSSWMPGEDWRGTVFQPIWETACQRNKKTAALCFGLILWQTMMDRPEKWGYGRYEMKGIPIEGLTYFELA